jgi:hypothetical protein
MLMKLGLPRSVAEDRMNILMSKLKEHKLMKGGAERKGVDGIADSVVDSLSTSESAAVFMSKLPQFVFILKSIEQNSPGGEVIGLAMDMFTTALSAGTDTAQLLIANIPGFGPMINFVIGLFIWPFLAMISLSRKEFEQSVEEYLKVIPLGIGKAMSTIFAKTDRLGIKVESRWDKISEQFALLIEKAKAAIEKSKIENPATARYVGDTASQAKNNAGQTSFATTDLAKARKADMLLKQSKAEQGAEDIGDLYSQGAKAGRRKRLSTKKRDTKNKKWRRTRRIKSVRR